MLEVVYGIVLFILFMIGDLLPVNVTLALAGVTALFAVPAAVFTAFEISSRSETPLSWLAIVGYSIFITGVNWVALAVVVYLT